MVALLGEARIRGILINLLYMKRSLLVSRNHDRLNRSLVQVMLDVATQHISRHQDLEFLVQSFRNRETDLELHGGLAKPSWIPDCWLKDTLHGLPYGSTGDHMYSHCNLRPIDISTMRLNVRGIKMDKSRELFYLEPNSGGITVMQSWTSPLVQHLQTYMTDNTADLPPHILRILSRKWEFGEASHEDFKSGFDYLQQLSKNTELAKCIFSDRDNVLLPN
jgi:hypothetical protein